MIAGDCIFKNKTFSFQEIRELVFGRCEVIFLDYRK